MTHIETPDIPDLRIVPLQAVFPHEEHDDQRAGPLVKRIPESGIWLHPPIVTTIDWHKRADDPEQRYALLDGANRYNALKKLGYPYILVQVVPYPGETVTLETWHHVLSKTDPALIFNRIRELEAKGTFKIEKSDTSGGRMALAQHEAIAYIRLFSEKDIYMLLVDGSDVHRRNPILRALVNTYKNDAILDRIDRDDPNMIQKLYPDAALLMVYPRYAPDEIIVAARDDNLLPPGISRHIIQGRAMRLNYPLEPLQTEGDLTAKNEALNTWTQRRVSEKRVRFYEESMYLFDD